MKKNMGKKILIFTFLFTAGIGIVFAADNYIRTGNNWDANVLGTETANDNFNLDGRLDLEDSRSSAYALGDRGKITGTIDSDLFGKFNIVDNLALKYKENFNSSHNCGAGETPLEIYSISGSINSPYWADEQSNGTKGELVVQSDSYFCSNEYIYLKLKSDSLGEKEIGNIAQSNLIDNFGKQEIAISGIVNIKGDLESDIENRGDGSFNKLGVSVSSKTLIKKNLSKNIFSLFNTYGKINKVKTISTSLNSFSPSPITNNSGEKFFLYDYSGKTDKNIDFQGTGDYLNKGEYLSIGNSGTSEIEIDGKNTVIVKSGNIYINSNLYNKNDNNSILVLVAKRDKNTGKGGNIYIDPDVTNIDAVLIADGSLISMDTGTIQSVGDDHQMNNLRKQLLIYGSVLSSNVIGSHKIPYGADYYENSGYTPDRNNIYDLGNLRSFNLNYGSGSLDGNKLVPIDGSGGFKEYAWSGKCQWYNGENCEADLRTSDKKNPLIIEYNSRIKALNPFILRNK